MAGAPVLLLASDSEWKLVAPDGNSRVVGETAESPEAVLARVLEASSSSLRLGLLLEASQVLHTCFPSSELGQVTEKSIAFRVEADLPLSAEEIWTDHVLVGEQISAFAIEGRVFSKWLDACETLSVESRRIELSSLVPVSLAQVQSLVDSRTVPQACKLLLVGRDRSELFRLSNGKPGQWRLVQNGATEAEWQLTLRESDGSSSKSLYCIGDAEAFADLAFPESTDARWIEGEPQAMAVGLGHEFLTRRKKPWIDFTRDVDFGDNARAGAQLARQWLLVASVFFLLLSGCFLLRASLLNWAIRQVQQERASVFISTFPGQRQPTAVLKRFRSEWAKVQGARDTQSNDLTPPQQAVLDLGELLATLPTDVPFSVSEFRIENGSVYLDLEIRQHEDAGLIVEAMDSERWSFEPPSTDAVDGKIVALIRGQRRVR
ncbi:MAG: hypothetical protein VXZ82_23365 [Planctomycetota bacterium]|nr:hypothetical protein [Planctomycetota bacterium]